MTHPKIKKFGGCFYALRQDQRLTQTLAPPKLASMDQLPVPQGPLAEASLFDQKDARSVINLVPPVVKQALEEHVFERGELFGHDEHTLYKNLRHENKQPTATDNRLRLKFWMEYDRVTFSKGAVINMSNVLSGVCSRELFYTRYIKSAEKMAWLMTPPTGYMAKAEEALEFGLEQLRDILDQPHVVGGKIDTKLGALKAKIVNMLDARVKGAIVQRTMSLNVSTNNRDVARAAMAGTAEELMKQLKDLEAKNRKAQNLPSSQSPVEVE